MIVIGIDPGTACGWSVLRDGQHVASGTWDLSSKRHEGGGMRYLRFRRYFRELLAGLDSPAVAYEEVRRHAGTSAAHVYGGIIAVLASECEELQVPYQSIPVATVKRKATGKGNASKGMMIEAARKRWGAQVQTHDEADALWIAVCLTDDLA